MSIRTLVEINHVMLHEIEKDPKRFTNALYHALCSGGLTKDQMDRSDGYDGESHARLYSFGAEVKHVRHHSEVCPTTTPNQ